MSLSPSELALPLPQRRWWRRRGLPVLLFLAYLSGLVYLGFMLFIYIRYNVLITSRSHTINYLQIIYPEFYTTGVLKIPPDDGDQHLNVVLIGGSTLEQTADELSIALKTAWKSDVRIYNLAKAAHTSRDTLFKFRELPVNNIDLIVLYDGFNDIRMNNVTRSDFMIDYTHCEWYLDLEQKLKLKQADLEDIMRHNLNAVGRRIRLDRPETHLIDEGAVIKTEDSFRQNISEILQSCQTRRIPVVLMTFASYLPENYSQERFVNGDLDYGSGDYRMAAESWGRPEAVRNTLAVHNRVLRELARSPEFAGTVRFIDQEELLAANGMHFSDPCHLTSEGIRQFVRNIVASLDKPTDIDVDATSSLRESD
ncbi:MAG: hypothetical protein ACKVT0_17770 [Planctomycetaceae bacterium]